MEWAASQSRNLRKNSMTEDSTASGCCSENRGKSRGCGVSGGVYGVAFVGAVVYYLQHATTFGEGVLGFLKALVWPAMLIYKLLEFLKM
jgi:hypothetical protein